MNLLAVLLGLLMVLDSGLATWSQRKLQLLRKAMEGRNVPQHHNAVHRRDLETQFPEEETAGTSRIEVLHDSNERLQQEVPLSVDWSAAVSPPVNINMHFNMPRSMFRFLHKHKHLQHTSRQGVRKPEPRKRFCVWKICPTSTDWNEED